jgi:transcriptional regulator
MAGPLDADDPVQANLPSTALLGRCRRTIHDKEKMYLPKHFEETDRSTLHRLIESHPLAALVTLGDGELVVNHIPFMVDAAAGAHGTLRGHVARANPVWRQFSASVPTVAIFQGPESYITPSWYPSKAEHGKVVPTWNYAVVHVHGVPRVIEQAAPLLALVTALTVHHEAKIGSGWQVSDAPPDYIDQMVASIVGVEIPIGRIEGKWKVSQNRAAADRAAVALALDALAGDQIDPRRAMAALVRR